MLVTIIESERYGTVFGGLTMDSGSSLHPWLSVHAASIFDVTVFKFESDFQQLCVDEADLALKQLIT